MPSRDRGRKGRAEAAKPASAKGEEKPSREPKAEPVVAPRKGTRERVPKTPLSPVQNTKPQKQKKAATGSAAGGGGGGGGSGGGGGGGGGGNGEAQTTKPPPAARPAASRNAADQQGSKPSRAKNDRKMQSDAELVADVRTYMKANKLSQVTVGQEARISQAVISQWLSLKYHGHNDKVRAHATFFPSPPQARQQAGRRTRPGPRSEHAAYPAFCTPLAPRSTRQCASG
jgi:predicted XRE-type DNA-binding protein